MVIQYLKHAQIDSLQWDNCVKKAGNSMVYGMSWYLNSVCQHWDALVADNYKAVMPLPWKSRYGVKYIYPPFFAQQLGVFTQTRSPLLIDDFLKAIPRKFVKVEYPINYLNSANNFQLAERVNSVLLLDNPYADCYKAFSENTRRNIKKAVNHNFILTDSVEINTFLNLKRENNINNLKSAQFKTLAKLFNESINRNLAQIKGVKNKNGQLIAAALFITFENRITYLFSASSAEGKANRAMFLIINETIKAQAGSSKILDFEGSMLPDVDRFFKGFGAVDQNYSRVAFFQYPFLNKAKTVFES